MYKNLKPLIDLGGTACASKMPKHPKTEKPKIATPDCFFRPSEQLLMLVEVDENEGHAYYDPDCEKGRLDPLRYGLSKRDFRKVKVFII